MCRTSPAAAGAAAHPAVPAPSPGPRATTRPRSPSRHSLAEQAGAAAPAFEMGENRHARFRLHTGDEAFSAARHDHVDIAGKAGQHLADGGAVGGRHDLDGVFGQASLG